MNRGNSGGPLVYAEDDKDNDVEFQVVGIVNAVVSGAQGICFAILVDRLLWVTDVFIQTDDQIQPPLALDITYQKGSEVIRNYLLRLSTGDAQTSGVLVTKAGHERTFKKFDYICTFAGLQVDDSGCVEDLRLSKAAPSLPLQIYASREPLNSFLKVEFFRPESESKFERKDGLHYVRRRAHVHIMVKWPRIREVYVPYEAVDFEVLCGMVLTNISTTALRKCKRPIVDAKPGIMITDLIPQGEVAHTLAEYAKPGTIIKTVNNAEIQSLDVLRALFVQHWNPEENTLLIETEHGYLLTLPLETVHQDNKYVYVIHGEFAMSHSIPFYGAHENPKGVRPRTGQFSEHLLKGRINRANSACIPAQRDIVNFQGIPYFRK